MSHYQKRIIRVTGCTPEEATAVEEVMRQDIFHSTLDWQPARLFDRAARVAYRALLEAAHAQYPALRGEDA